MNIELKKLCVFCMKNILFLFLGMHSIYPFNI